MKSIYLYNAINTFNDDENNEEIYFVSRLLNLRNSFILGKEQESTFCKSLLELLNKHQGFEDVFRVCIALHSPLSNKIEVLDSAVQSGENTMDSGYSCFVGENSSLTQISSGGCRVFSDIQEILDSYQKNNAFIQKSIYNLSLMGVKSGFTVRLKSNSLEGYLFLNSKKVNYFNNHIKRYATSLNVLEMLAQEFFNKKVSDLTNVSNIQTYISEFPRGDILSNCHLEGGPGLKKIAKRISYFLQEDLEIEISDNTDKDSLIPWGQVTLVFSLLMREVGIQEKSKMQIVLSCVEDDVIVQLSSKELPESLPKLSFDHYRAIRKFVNRLGMELVSIKGGFSLKVPFERGTLDNNSGYSLAEISDKVLVS